MSLNSDAEGLSQSSVERDTEHKIAGDRLLDAARALDNGNLNEARDRLRSLPFIRFTLPHGLIASALWKRLLKAELPADAAGEETLAAFERLAAVALHREKMWDAYDAIPILMKSLGDADTASIVTSIIWECVLASEPTLFLRIFELLFKLGDERCVVAMEQFLAAQKSYHPLYWDYVLMSRAVTVRNARDLSSLTERILQNTGRNDLFRLFEIYMLQMRQAPVREITVAARSLPDPAQRSVVLQYMTHMSYTLDDLRLVMANLPHLIGPAAKDGVTVSFMQARLAVAEARWHDAAKLALSARGDHDFRHHADLLFALASAHLKKFQDAETTLQSVQNDETSSPFQKSRATFISVTSALVKEGRQLPEENKSPLPAPLAGRPLVQSLWVGKKLRWIERLCIKSYLEHGWRFQLYVYDEPDNVPDGCEIMDASAIIPTKDIFIEGYGSGHHAGSVGAFSDLFRYQLLCKRGGLWTDTDVINRGMYDVDGRSFVSTEYTDAGIVTINGAIMAAPANDPFVSEAYTRARTLLASDAMFFTRIGPFLLAELILERGARNVEMMQPSFLGPVSWMNVASLLQPFDTLMMRREFQEATNIHVYTEMWRTLGLGLDRPASKSTFLGKLYFDYFGE